MFNGRSAGGDGLIQFNLPVMKDKLREGIYLARVEVLIENRYFSPVQFQVNFKKAVKVVAEAINVLPRKQSAEVSVSAIPVIRPKQEESSNAILSTGNLSDKTNAREAPPPAREAAQLTLRERYHAKRDNLSLDDEVAILSAAQSFVKTQRKK
jgi:hypothetical protein